MQKMLRQAIWLLPLINILTLAILFNGNQASIPLLYTTAIIAIASIPLGYVIANNFQLLSDSYSKLPLIIRFIIIVIPTCLLVWSVYLLSNQVIIKYWLGIPIYLLIVSIISAASIRHKLRDECLYEYRIYLYKLWREEMEDMPEEIINEGSLKKDMSWIIPNYVPAKSLEKLIDYTHAYFAGKNREKNIENIRALAKKLADEI